MWWVHTKIFRCLCAIRSRDNDQLSTRCTLMVYDSCMEYIHTMTFSKLESSSLTYTVQEWTNLLESLLSIYKCGCAGSNTSARITGELDRQQSHVWGRPLSQRQRPKAIQYVCQSIWSRGSGLLARFYSRLGQQKQRYLAHDRIGAWWHSPDCIVVIQCDARQPDHCIHLATAVGQTHWHNFTLLSTRPGALSA